ncbi:MAG: hypothetical protein LBS25_09700, partial [Candidatus Symbiothrix sp.]|nr:hypothetical protein [Candidatus Symbiothrix sp.]
RFCSERAVDYSILFFAFFAYLLCELCGKKYLTARDAKVSQRALSFIYNSFYSMDQRPMLWNAY